MSMTFSPTKLTPAESHFRLLLVRLISQAERAGHWPIAICLRVLLIQQGSR